MKWINAVLVIIAVLLCSSTGAEEQTLTEFSFKEVSCGQWKKLADSVIGRAQYASWFRGFVSGYNFGNPGNQVRRMPDVDTLALYVDKYCKENPLEQFTSAAQGLVVELLARPEQTALNPDRK
jgi:hypothetical protein